MKSGLHSVLFGLLLAGLAGTETQASIPLATDGRSDYRIVIPKDAIGSEKHAAAELQSFLKQISGAELAIVDDAEAMPGYAILLGKTAHLAPLKVEVDWRKLGQEGFTIRTVGRHLVIAGGRPRGTLYGVYTFLEDHLGCRWFSSKASRIPKRASITLGDINDTQVPVLEYREPFWFDAFDADWAARNKCNSAHARLDETRGGKIVYTGFVHTFNPLVPPEKYFDEHPEYFSLIGGKRMKGYYQLCLTNPDVLRITIEAVRNLLRANPGTNIVSVSQNDTGGWCECENCKKVEAEEGGVHAGPIIRFVNAVAEAIEKEFPNVAVDTLAYQYSRAPVTKTRPRHNVIVRLCSIECCFSHPLEEEDTAFKKDIVGWSKMCDRLYVWDYVTTFGHYVLPFSNIEVLQPNVRFFVRHGVKGLFEEGAYQSNGAEMAELKAYLLAKLLWNPDCDVEKHRADFLEGYYGRAAGVIDRYLRLLREHVLARKIHQPIWINPESGHVPPEIIKKANTLFDEAERLVADAPDVLHRVHVARLPIQYVQLSRFRMETSRPWGIRGDMYGPEPDPEKLKLADRFFAVCKKENVTHLNEGGFHPNAFREQVMSRIGGVRLVTLENAGLRLRIAPDLGGRIVAIEEKARNRSITTLPSPTTPGFPNVGGYWETAGLGRRWLGATDRFSVEDQPGPDRITLTARLTDGLTLKRVIRLERDAAAFTVESSLTNTAGEPRSARVQTHLELSLGGENVVLKGGGQEVSLSIPAEANVHRVWWVDQAVPRDGWALSGPCGVQVRCQVTGHVARYLFENRAAGPLVTVRATTGQKMLEPKGTLTLASRVELVPVPEQAPVKSEHRPGLVEVQEDEFSLFREGELSGVKEDATASDGLVAWMPGHHVEWAIQWPVDPARFQSGATYEVAAVLRFDVKGRQGGACTFGVYDTAKRAGACGGQLTAADAKTDWQTVTIGRFKPATNQYVWIAPVNNAANIGAVHVDKMIFKQIDEKTKP